MATLTLAEFWLGRRVAGQLAEPHYHHWSAAHSGAAHPGGPPGGCSVPPDVHRLALAAHEMTERLRGAPAYDTQILATAQALSLTAMLDLLVDEYEAARLGRPAWCPDAVEP